MKPLDLVLAHTIETLPDSINSRRALLAATLEVMPARHPHRAKVSAMLLHLIDQDRTQLELPISLRSMATKKN